MLNIFSTGTSGGPGRSEWAPWWSLMVCVCMPWLSFPSGPSTPIHTGPMPRFWRNVHISGPYSETLQRSPFSPHSSPGTDFQTFAGENIRCGAEWFVLKEMMHCLILFPNYFQTTELIAEKKTDACFRHFSPGPTTWKRKWKMCRQKPFHCQANANAKCMQADNTKITLQ